MFVLNNPHYNNLGAVRRKFSSSKFHGVSGMKLDDFGVVYERLRGVIGGPEVNDAGEGEVRFEDRQF